MEHLVRCGFDFLFPRAIGFGGEGHGRLRHGCCDFCSLEGFNDRAAVAQAIKRVAIGLRRCIPQIVQRSGLHYIGIVVLMLGTLVVNIAIIAAVFRFLTSASPSWTDVWPGAISAAVSYTILQHYATLLVTRITENASDTYGQFALVLGLVTWLGLLAIGTLMSAELNAARVRLRREADAPAPAS